MGLSPRVRGNRSHRVRRIYPRRSIPACTGEPFPFGVGRVKEEVYPRVYGGTSGIPYRACRIKGLSPRVRGNPHRDMGPLRPYRSIPACTGEPPVDERPSTPVAVYPRVYGGTLELVQDRQRSAGLSPRVRGNRDALLPGCPRLRSIPACTGEPYRSYEGVRRVRVYPRVYGGTGDEEDEAQDQEGLSPRVRGNP